MRGGIHHQWGTQTKRRARVHVEQNCTIVDNPIPPDKLVTTPDVAIQNGRALDEAFRHLPERYEQQHVVGQIPTFWKWKLHFNNKSLAHSQPHIAETTSPRAERQGGGTEEEPLAPWKLATVKGSPGKPAQPPISARWTDSLRSRSHIRQTSCQGQRPPSHLMCSLAYT